MSAPARDEERVDARPAAIEGASNEWQSDAGLDPTVRRVRDEAEVVERAPELAIRFGEDLRGPGDVEEEDSVEEGEDDAMTRGRCRHGPIICATRVAGQNPGMTGSGSPAGRDAR